MTSLKVGEGPKRTGRSVGLFARIHWRVDLEVDMLTFALYYV